MSSDSRVTHRTTQLILSPKQQPGSTPSCLSELVTHYQQWLLPAVLWSRLTSSSCLCDTSSAILQPSFLSHACSHEWEVSLEYKCKIEGSVAMGCRPFFVSPQPPHVRPVLIGRLPLAGTMLRDWQANCSGFYSWGCEYLGGSQTCQIQICTSTEKYQILHDPTLATHHDSTLAISSSLCVLWHKAVRNPVNGFCFLISRLFTLPRIPPLFPVACPFSILRGYLFPGPFTPLSLFFSDQFLRASWLSVPQSTRFPCDVFIADGRISDLQPFFLVIAVLPNHFMSKIWTHSVCPSLSFLLIDISVLNTLIYVNGLNNGSTLVNTTTVLISHNISKYYLNW